MQDNYLDYAQRIWKPLSFTFYQATLSTVITLLIGMPAAFLFANYDFPLKKFLNLFLTIPFLLPTVVVAASFNTLMGPQGWINLLLMRILQTASPPINILNTIYAILIAHIFYNTSIIVRIVSVAWLRMDYRLEQSARVLGASPMRTFTSVTFPLLKPAIISAILLVFLFNFTSFGVIMLLGGPKFATLEVEIFIQTLQLLNLPFASVISVLQLLCTSLISLWSLQFGISSIIPFIPRIKGERLKRARSWIERIMIVGLVILFVVIFVITLASLVLRSFIIITESTSIERSLQIKFSLQYFRELFINRRQSLFYVPPIMAVRNSLSVAMITSVIAILLGVIISYAQNAKKEINAFMNVIVMLPLGTSAVTLGLGFVIAFSSLQNILPAYPILLPFAHSLVALPFVIRVIQPAIRSIPVSLHQAASVLGANAANIVKKVDLPMIFGPLVVAAVFAFTISLGEFGATTFLARPDYPTVPIAIYRYISLPGPLNYGQSLAMAVILLAISTLSIFVMDTIHNHYIKNNK